LTCVRVCPYDVPRINAEGVAEIECPAKAIQLMHYKDRQIIAKTRSLLREMEVQAEK